MPAVGVFRGTVVNNADPEKSGRLQVSVPAVTGFGAVNWAAPATPSGFPVIPPKPGDPVWVMFESGDVNSPVWMGIPSQVGGGGSGTTVSFDALNVGALTVTGTVTVPDASIPVAKISGLTSALGNYVTLNTSQTVTALKYFTGGADVVGAKLSFSGGGANTWLQDIWGVVISGDTTHPAQVRSTALLVGQTPASGGSYTTGDVVGTRLFEGADRVVTVGSSQTITGDKTFTLAPTITVGGQALNIKAGASVDHVYMGFYARSASQTTRTSWFGVGSTASTTLTLANEMANGSLDLTTSGTGAVRVTNGGGGLQVTGPVTTSGTLRVDGNQIDVYGQSPTIGLRDTDAGSGFRAAWWHLNSGQIYLLSNETDVNAGWDNNYPLVITTTSANFRSQVQAPTVNATTSALIGNNNNAKLTINRNTQAGTGQQGDWQSAHLELQGQTGAGSTALAAQHIKMTFHSPNAFAVSLGVTGNDGTIRTFNQGGTGYQAFAAGDITSVGTLYGNGLLVAPGSVNIRSVNGVGLDVDTSTTGGWARAFRVGNTAASTNRKYGTMGAYGDGTNAAEDFLALPDTTTEDLTGYNAAGRMSLYSDGRVQVRSATNTKGLIVAPQQANDAPIYLRPGGNSTNNTAAVGIEAYGYSGQSDMRFQIENYGGNFQWQVGSGAGFVTKMTLVAANGNLQTAGTITEGTERVYSKNNEPTRAWNFMMMGA
jgi:hypothetical protein